MQAERQPRQFGARIESVTRRGFDKVKTPGREGAPFVLRVRTASGDSEVVARAVLDASGTWTTPNWMGASGVPALGEREHRARITYGMPDILGAARERYAGKRVLVVGAGHSAIGNLIALSELALLLGVAAALNFLAFANPSHERRAQAVVASTTEPTCPRGVRWLIAAFAGVSFVSAALSAHLPGTLQALRIDSEVAVWIAATVGVMQVIGRALEFASGRRIPAAKLGLLTFAAVFVSLLLLLGSTGKSALALGFALVYGAANGMLTVVGAVLPRELFGTANLGAVLGRFAAPSRIARAVAPWAFSIAASPLGAWGATACVASIAGLSLVTYLLVPLTTTHTEARF